MYINIYYTCAIKKAMQLFPLSNVFSMGRPSCCARPRVWPKPSRPGSPPSPGPQQPGGGGKGWETLPGLVMTVCYRKWPI